MAVHPKKAFFLDRDGTINIDYPYISSPSQIELIPEAVSGLKKIRDAGYAIFVVSNQSGIGRGLIEAEKIESIHTRLDAVLEQAGAPEIDEYVYCPHHPKDECDCRKPMTKLVLALAEKHGIDLTESFFVGDKISDVQTGVNAGCKASVLVLTGKGILEVHKLREGNSEAEHPVFTAHNLDDAVDHCLSL